MARNNDRWSALSMSERADLIKLYVENGITNIGDIRKHYNSFDEGGTIEPLYYDDTYIEPAVVKAFKSQEDYNRFLGEKGARTVREGTNRVAQKIFKGLQYTPVVGDSIDIADAAISVGEGNYKKAGILAGMALLPNALEKPVKALGKGIRNLRVYNRYTKDAERFREAVEYPVNKYIERADRLNSNYGGTQNKRVLNTPEDLKVTALGEPINTNFTLRALNPKLGGSYNPNTGEIWLNRFSPSLIKRAWDSPTKAIKILKGIGAHEGTHRALYALNDKLVETVEKSYPIANSNHPLYDRVGYAFSDPSIEATAWQRSPEEFVGNMNLVEYVTGMSPNTDVKYWDAETRNMLSNFLSREHGFTTEDALFLADELSNFGYKNGGKLNRYTTGGPVKTFDVNNPISPTQYWEDFIAENSVPFSIAPEAAIDEKELVRRQAWAESAGNDRAGSHKGAKGRYQIMPDTLSEYQKATGDIGDIYDPVYNRRVRDWEFNRYKNSDQVNRGEPTDSVKMGRRLAIYNYGYGNVRKALNKADSLGADTDNSFEWLQYLPQETQDYVNFILRNKDTGAHRTNNAYKNRKK